MLLDEESLENLVRRVDGDLLKSPFSVVCVNSSTDIEVIDSSNEPGKYLAALDCFIRDYLDARVCYPQLYARKGELLYEMSNQFPVDSDRWRSLLSLALDNYLMLENQLEDQKVTKDFQSPKKLGRKNGDGSCTIITYRKKPFDEGKARLRKESIFPDLIRWYYFVAYQRYQMVDALFEDMFEDGVTALRKLMCDGFLDKDLDKKLTNILFARVQDKSEREERDFGKLGLTAVPDVIDVHALMDGDFSHGGRDVAPIKGGISQAKTTSVSVSGVSVNNLEREARYRRHFADVMKGQDLVVSFPETIGFFRNVNGSVHRIDTEVKGVSLDALLRDENTKFIGLGVLPYLVKVLAYMHDRIASIFEQWKRIVVPTLIKKFQADTSRCKMFLTDDTRSDIVKMGRALRIIESTAFIDDLDSHPQQFLVDYEQRNGVINIKTIGRVDFEFRGAVPFPVELANLYRYGSYGGVCFDFDFEALEHYVTFFNEQTVPRGYTPIDVHPHAAQLLYLNSVIFRMLCFYEAWFKRERRQHMLPRVPEILVNADLALGEIESRFPRYFNAHRDAYTSLRRTLPRLEQYARDALGR